MVERAAEVEQIDRTKDRMITALGCELPSIDAKESFIPSRVREQYQEFVAGRHEIIDDRLGTLPVRVLVLGRGQRHRRQPRGTNVSIVPCC